MPRRSVVVTGAVLVALITGSARAWIAMGDNVPKLRPTGVRPLNGSAIKPQLTHTKGAPAKTRSTPAPTFPTLQGHLPVLALTWVGPDGLADAEPPTDLFTTSLTPPPGEWDYVEVDLAEGAWLPGEGDLTGQTWIIPLGDPGATGPLHLSLPARSPDAPALDGALLGAED